MSKSRSTPCWADLISSATADPNSSTDRDRFLDHIAECSTCRYVFNTLEAEGMFAGWPEVQPLETDRTASIRERLMARAVAEPQEVRAEREGWQRISFGAAGWLVAAGMASLLLTHHSFHRPLDLGWLAASALGVVVLVLGYQVYALRKRLRDG